MKMQNDKLLTCPFCGGVAEVDKILDVDYRWLVRCQRCFCKTTTFATEKSAVITWNTRKPMERIVEKLEERRKLHNELSKSNKLTDEERLIQTRFDGCFTKSIAIVRNGGKE